MKKKSKKSGSPKKKMGAPTKFTPQIAEVANRLASKGLDDIEISEIIGICPRTLNYWKGRYSDFMQSLKAHKEIADDMVETSLFRRATGYYHEEEKLFYDSKLGYVHRETTVKHYPPDTSAAICTVIRFHEHPRAHKIDVAVLVHRQSPDREER